MSLPFTDNVTILNAVATTTTSDYYDVSKRQQVTLEFIAAGGTTVFSVDVCNGDPTVASNWVTGIAFKDATQTAGATLATSKSVASSNAGAIVPAGFRFIRVVATVSSGTATAVLEDAG